MGKGGAPRDYTVADAEQELAAAGTAKVAIIAVRTGECAQRH